MTTKQQEIDELKYANQMLREQLNELSEKRQVLDLRLQTAIEQNDEDAARIRKLKGKCNELYGENCKLRGYLDRVLDTDKMDRAPVYNCDVEQQTHAPLQNGELGFGQLHATDYCRQKHRPDEWYEI